MPIGFKILPGSVFCLICNRLAAMYLDTLPRCPRCGSSYCQNCMIKGEPSLRCADDAAACPLNLHAPDPPSAA